MTCDDVDYTIVKRELECCRETNKLRKREAELLKGMLDDALDYGLKKNQENTRLLRRIIGLEGKIREVMEDGENRVHENK